MILNSFLDFSSKYFLEIGKLQLTWYSLCILSGIFVAAYLGIKEAHRFGLSTNFILDGLLMCVPLSIIGARIYYVMFAWNEFYVEGEFLTTLEHIIGYYNGSFQLSGLSITGAVIVAVVFVFVYSRKKKVNPLVVYDFLAPGLLIGQIMGRWGNFFNQEAHGGPISEQTFQWLQYIIPQFIMNKMKIGGTYYHPTFLYEGLWNTALFIFILIARRKNRKARIGDNICLYLMWYGLGRACLIEPFRTDPLMFMGLRINIIVPLIFFVIGVIWFVLKHTKFKDEYYIEKQEAYDLIKPDGIILKAEGVLVDESALLKNCYYYTAQEYKKIDLSEAELSEIYRKDPKEYFETEEELAFFETYFYEHLDNLIFKQKPSEFMKGLYQDDFGIVLMTKYKEEFAVFVLEQLNFMRYISIVLSETEDVNNARNQIKEKKNIIFICDQENEVNAAKELEMKSALVTYSAHYDEASNAGPDYFVTSLLDLADIIV